MLKILRGTFYLTVSKHPKYIYQKKTEYPMPQYLPETFHSDPSHSHILHATSCHTMHTLFSLLLLFHIDILHSFAPVMLTIFLCLQTNVKATFISIKDPVRRGQQSGIDGVQVKFHSLKPLTQSIFCQDCALTARWLSNSFPYLWVSLEKGLHPVLPRAVVFEAGLA